MSALRNPPLILAWGLPIVAVVASVVSLVLALAHPDGELPEQYHWEGFQLDRDFSRGERAEQLHVQGVLTGLEQGGVCQLSLTLSGEAPAAVQVRVTHATMPALDQQLTLRRVSAPSRPATEGSFDTAQEARSSFPGSSRPAIEGFFDPARMTHGPRADSTRSLPLGSSRPAIEGFRNSSSSYAGDCRATPDAHWRLELTDAANTWALRTSARSSLNSVTLNAATDHDG